MPPCQAPNPNPLPFLAKGRFQRSHAACSPPRAFTLVELLVATAILGLLILLLAQVSNSIGQTWISGSSRAEHQQTGRTLLDFIAQELRAATLPVDRTDDPAAADLQFVVNPPQLPSAFTHPHAIFWQAPLATDRTWGDMAVLGYFVRWHAPTVTQPPHASLCRVLINPQSPDTVAGTRQHLIYQESQNWIQENLLDQVAAADDTSTYAGLFAENVIAFWIRCLDSRGNLITQNGIPAGSYDSRLGYSGEARDATGQWVAYQHPAPVLPHRVQISLATLSSPAAARLTPALVALIRQSAAASQSSPTPSAEFVDALRGQPAARPILPGLSAHSLTVSLENAP